MDLDSFKKQARLLSFERDTYLFVCGIIKIPPQTFQYNELYNGWTLKYIHLEIIELDRNIRKLKNLYELQSK